MGEISTKILGHPPLLGDALKRSKLVSLNKRSDFSLHRLYDSAASSYSRDEPKFRDDLISRPIVVELAEFFGRDGNIIDVGCGDGHIGRLVSQFAHRVLGVDISNGMLSEALAKSRNFNNLSFLRANFLNLVPDVPSLRFDVALCIYAFCCVRSSRHLQWAANNLFRVLRKGGKAIVQIPDEAEGEGLRSSLWVRDTDYSPSASSRLVIRDLKTVDDEWVTVGRYSYSERQYIDCFRSAGFKIDTILKPLAQEGTLKLFSSLEHEAEISSTIILVLSK